LVFFVGFSAAAEIKKPSIMLYDFEGDLSENFPAFLKSETEKEFVKEGTQSGKWENLKANRWLEIKNFPTDWSAYDTVSFWMYSEHATGEEMRFNVHSDKEKPMGGNYYTFTFFVNWSGWKEFAIPFEKFGISRNPVGWQMITTMIMYPQSGGASPETVLYLDKFMLSQRREPPGPLTGLRPASALTVYIDAEKAVTADIVFRSTDDAKPNRVMLRVFDAKETLVLRKFIVMSNSVKSEGILAKETVEMVKPGIYQVRVIAGCRRVAVDIRLSKDTGWGVSFQNGDYSSWPKMPEKMYTYIPHKAEKLFIEGGPVTIRDENQKDLFSGKKKGEITVNKNKTVWEILPDPAGKFTAYGFPFILCNTSEAAEKIKASIRVLPDGTAVSWKFQEEAQLLIKKYAQTEYVGRNEDLTVDFNKVKNVLRQDPIRNEQLIVSYDGVLRPLNAIINSQNLNSADHWCGAIDFWQSASQKTEPENRWDRLYAVRHGSFEKDSAGLAAYKLAFAASFRHEANLWHGKKELLYRAALASLRDITQISESEIGLSTYAEQSFYPGNMGFLMPRFLHAYPYVNPQMPEDIKRVWTRGLQHLIDRHLAEEIVSCQNQSSHFILAFQEFYKGSGLKEYGKDAQNFAKYFAESASPAGWQPEALGPCASYNGISHWYMGEYYRMSGDEVMRKALADSYRFFNHTVSVEPSGRVIAGFSFNHRVNRGFNFSQYGGAKGIADMIPEIGAWANTGVLSIKQREEQALASIDAFLTNVPRTLESAGTGSLSYPFSIGRTKNYLPPDSALVLPEKEKGDFIRNIGNELIAVKQSGYFTSVYVGKPVPDSWYLRYREELRKVREGEENEGPISTYQCTPMLGGGLTIFSVSEFGSALVTANWTPYTHHGLVAFIGDKRYWEDYMATEFSFDERRRTLEITGRIENVPVTYNRTYVFQKEALEVRVVLSAVSNVTLQRLFENIPVIIGQLKENGSVITVLGSDQNAKGFTVTDKNGKGAQFLFRKSQNLHIVRNGLKDRDGLHLGRVEILFPASLAEGEQAEISYSMGPVQSVGK